MVCCELLPLEDVEWHDFGGGKAKFQVVSVVNGMASPRPRGGAMAPGAIASVPPSSQLLDAEPPPWL